MANLGERITQLRKQKGWSQTELAKNISASREAVGKYERGEASPSVETAKKIADVFEVTLDYLVDDLSLARFDKKVAQRFRDIEQLNEKEKEHLFALMDAFLRDAKTRLAYSS